MTEQITRVQAQREMMRNFISEIKKLPEQIDSFDENAWYALVDYVTVYS